MGPAYRAAFADALQVLAAIKSRASARSIPVDFDGTRLPTVSAHNDVTDAYLVALAGAHGLQLVTLDESLVVNPWAAGIAFHPFAPRGK